MWGQVTVGGITFREETDVEESGDGLLSIAGQESTPPSPASYVRSIHHNVRAMEGKIVPVTFTDKTHLTGFYLVTDARSAFSDFANGIVVTSNWSLRLSKIGASADVEFESRLTFIGRTDNLAGAQTPNFWHAPAGAARDYYTGSTVPAGTVSRISADGALSVFSGVPAVPPRWTCPASGYLVGAARVLLDGYPYVGVVTMPHTTWEVSNGLVRLTPTETGVQVEAWSGSPGGWRSASEWRFTVAGAQLTGTPEMTILQNDPEQVRLRLSYLGTPGRTTVDLTLRRGSRFVTGVIKRHSAATLGVQRSPSAVAVDTPTGGIRQTAVDADGNRFVVGSSKVLTASGASATVSRAAVTVLDFFIGHEVGNPAASGDLFADLLLQYLGTVGDQTRVMTR